MDNLKREKKTVYRIAEKHDIDLSEAKQFFYDRKKARMNGMNLPFHKWKKKNLNFDDTIDGNDIEEGDFDNFFSRKKRKAIKRGLRKISKGAKKRFGRINRAVLSGGLSELKKKRLRKVRRHKGLLKRLANPIFMANPRNAMKVRSKIKDLVRSINRNDKRAIKFAQAQAQGRPAVMGRPNPYWRPKNRFDGFDGYSDDLFLNADGNKLMDKVKKNKWLLIGGAVAFLFLTPMGKKLIKG